MTNTEINIAIAEACGWKRELLADELCNENFEAWSRNGIRLITPTALPDYCSDLNAMHEAEAAIDRAGLELISRYRDALFSAVGLNPVYWAHECPSVEFLRVARATARQRAEAFLRTLGKWEC